ncbi:uncharacterized protein YqjF (DUF2071 family) [Chryseobacterium defluvii]|uniref:Uncharacterized protein YqjF (DUF2071 family) n=1 Tax=Chryseobacterium defluvii TaxID=160396 RepID=A0A840K5M7_9FLAO|nr:DUF2071 domain-containing protein [Chryseobacterium defluvii]MBB4804871.1 uncharacterized protein YqjF (DUF2071 family) [Chryseobacterium defluvii]
MMKKKYKFMTCNWENLIYLNFHMDPELLAPFLPKDTEPDLLNGKAVISIVCFEFSNARLFGFKIPFHQYFPEINIRTYVKKKDNGNIKGIYFLSEMVPKFMTYFTGKFIYGEPFSLRKLKISKTEKDLKYFIKDSGCEMEIEAGKKNMHSDRELTEEEEFVIERSLAFCGKASQNARMYEVKHQKWNLVESSNFNFTIKKIRHISSDIQNVLLDKKPESIFMTDGSGVEVYKDLFI